MNKPRRSHLYSQWEKMIREGVAEWIKVFSQVSLAPSVSSSSQPSTPLPFPSFFEFHPMLSENYEIPVYDSLGLSKRPLGVICRDEVVLGLEMLGKDFMRVQFRNNPFAYVRYTWINSPFSTYLLPLYSSLSKEDKSSISLSKRWNIKNDKQNRKLFIQQKKLNRKLESRNKKRGSSQVLTKQSSSSKTSLSKVVPMESRSTEQSYLLVGRNQNHQNIVEDNVSALTERTADYQLLNEEDMGSNNQYENDIISSSSSSGINGDPIMLRLRKNIFPSPLDDPYFQPVNPLVSFLPPQIWMVSPSLHERVRLKVRSKPTTDIKKGRVLGQLKPGLVFLVFGIVCSRWMAIKFFDNDCAWILLTVNGVDVVEKIGDRISHRIKPMMTQSPRLISDDILNPRYDGSRDEFWIITDVDMKTVDWSQNNIDQPDKYEY